MANICTFIMRLKGKKDRVNLILDMLQQKGDIYMGRGAAVYTETVLDADDNNYLLQIDGGTKWSVNESLIICADNMRKYPSEWSFDRPTEELTFISLFEACERFKIDMECFSEEDGEEFIEHLLFKDGKVLKNKKADFDKADEAMQEQVFSF